MLNKYKVVLVDYDDDLFSPLGWEGDILSSIGAAFHVGQYRTTEDVLRVTEDADVVMIQSVRPLLNGEVIRKMKQCRCIIRLGIGYDSVDVKAATNCNIIVCNIPLYCVDDVAEHALALLLDGARHISLQDRMIRASQWDRRKARPSRRLRSSTLGIVSMGRIAQRLAQCAKGLFANVLGFDPYVNSATMAKLGVEKVELNELLSRSDFISVHTPLTDSTHHLLGRHEFEIIKQGAVLVNTSRGGVIDTQALVKAMQSQKLWAAGLDVMEQEPLPQDSPLRQLPNVSFTPHVGACTDESVADLYRAACEIACDVLCGKTPASIANPEVIKKKK